MYCSHLPSRVFAGRDAMNQLPVICAEDRRVVLLVDPGVLQGPAVQAALESLRSTGVPAIRLRKSLTAVWRGRRTG